MDVKELSSKLDKLLETKLGNLIGYEHGKNNFLSVVLFNTKKHTYTIGDIISLISGMIILCYVIFVSLMVGIK